MLFFLYIVDIQQVTMSHSLVLYLYANDTQIYGSCRPAGVYELQQRVSGCLDNVGSSMRVHLLQLNTVTLQKLKSYGSPQVTVSSNYEQLGSTSEKMLSFHHNWSVIVEIFDTPIR